MVDLYSPFKNGSRFSEFGARDSCEASQGEPRVFGKSLSGGVYDHALRKADRLEVAVE